MRRDWRLLKWGAATQARIVSKSVGTGRSGAYLTLSYEFVDDSGRTIRGDRALWGDIKADGRSSDPKILDALYAPTVFYDRDDSQSHLFYPSSFADIRR